MNISLPQQAIAGLFLSLGGSMVFLLLQSVTLKQSAFELTLILISGGYIGYLLKCAPTAIGRLTTSILWLLATAVTYILFPGLMPLLILQLTAIWLVRSLYYYQRLWASLADGVLIIMGLVLSLWISSYTHSVLMSLWVFFFIQSLFAMLINQTEQQHDNTAEMAFEQSRQRAKEALKRSFHRRNMGL